MMTADERKQIIRTNLLSMFFMRVRRMTSITPNERDSARVMTAFVPFPSAEMAKLAAVAIATTPTIPRMKGSCKPTLTSSP
jgi:hypothetical protein